MGVELFLAASHRDRELLEGSAMGLFEHARIIAAGLFVVRLGDVDAMPHGLRDANRLGGALLELLLEVALLERAVPLGEGVALDGVVVLYEILGDLA